MKRKRFWTYRVETWSEKSFFTPSCWNPRKNGKPNAVNLSQWVRQVEVMLGEEPYKRFRFGLVVRARIIHQETDAVIAEWKRAGSGFVRLERSNRPA